MTQPAETGGRIPSSGRPPGISRRAALRALALGAVGAPLAGRAIPTGAAAEAPTSAARAPLRLGVASYSLRELPVDAFIATLGALRITNCGVHRAHIPWGESTDRVAAAARKFHDAGITVSGSGVIDLPDDEAALRLAFEQARETRLQTLVCKPRPSALPLVEKLAREFDQRLAIHNHGPEDPLYPGPEEAMRLVGGLDHRIGLCLDVGHAARHGADPAAAIRRYGARIYDVHLKDSVALPGAMRDIPAIVGAGRIDIRGILDALQDIRYPGVVALEFEKRGGNPVTGLAESLGFVRGTLRSLGGHEAG